MNLLSRLESLEKSTPGIAYPDHFVTYTVEYGEDEAAMREVALAEFKARHQPEAGATFGFIAYRIIEAENGRPNAVNHAWTRGPQERIIVSSVLKRDTGLTAWG